jgi:hypothetical protein
LGGQAVTYRRHPSGIRTQAMTRQMTVRHFRWGQCCLHLLVLGFSLLSWPVWAQDAPSSATGGHSGNGPELKSDPQIMPVQGNSALTALVPGGTTLPEPKDAPKEAINYGLPVGEWPWLYHPGAESSGPGAYPTEYPNPSGIAFGVGWWGVERSGNPWVIGQWQSTDPSPFWDVDGLYTNGTRTLNFSATGTDNESTRANVQYFGPNSQGFITFNRFPHAEENESFNNMNASAAIPSTAPGSPQPIIAQDLNKGQDLAIRVDQYEAQYKVNVLGQPGKNRDGPWISAGINIWDQQEMGNRQAISTQHCFTANPGQNQSCHVMSQTQGIDWNTFEVTPFLEGRFGNVNIRYEHTLRVFSSDDQTVLGTYTDGSATILNGQFPYAIVPQSLFNMDKIKVGIDVNDHNRLYAYGYFSEVENSEAGVSREQGGVDLRWTNTDIKGLNLTTYFKNDNQSGNRPTALLSPDQTAGLTQLQQQAELFQIPNQIGFTRYTAGEKFSWRPWTESCDSLLGRLAFTGGYEFDELFRANENYYFPSLSALPPTFAPSSTTPIFYQPNTSSNSFNVGVEVPWIEGVHTYARYKVKFVKDALYGYTPLNYAVSSNLPDTENIVEFGGEWFPSPRFGASLNQTINLSSRSGNPLPVAGVPTLVETSPGDTLNFGENSYNTSLVMWYRPTDKLTLSANSDYFTNWIKQNVTIGDDSDTSFSGSGANFVSFAPYTSPWTYGGTAVEFGGSVGYQVNKSLRFTADYEVTFGKDVITSGGVVVGSGTPVVNSSIPLGGFSAVRSVMQQASAGVDWKPRERMTVYLRYQLLDFNDREDSSNSGSLSMILGGINYKW